MLIGLKNNVLMAAIVPIAGARGRILSVCVTL